MSKYKIYYSGFAYVEADSEEEAEDKYSWDDIILDDKSIYCIVKVDEFTMEI